MISVFTIFAVETDTVGYVKIDAIDGADTKFGIPLERPTLVAGSVESIASQTITAAFDASAADDAYYIQFTSGALDGQWFQISSTIDTTITGAEDLESLGAAATDSFKVVPSWTLTSLFGKSFTVSTNVFAPIAQILLNDVTSEGINKAPNRNFAYHDGSSGFISAGWFDVSNTFAGAQDDVVLPPNTFITVRNQSGEDMSLILAGAVPTSELAIAVVASATVFNDNLVYNPYPVPIQLSLSALTDVVAVSSDPFSPAEQVIVYGPPSGLNLSPVSNYAYHDGSSGFVAAGWFDVSNSFGGSVDAIEIPAYGAFLIRKSPGGTDGYWLATIPYTL